MTLTFAYSERFAADLPQLRELATRIETRLAAFARTPPEASSASTISRRSSLRSRSRSPAGASGPRRWPAGDEALRKAVRAVASGQILALKGLGGFQLVVDATDAPAVRRLRQNTSPSGIEREAINTSPAVSVAPPIPAASSPPVGPALGQHGVNIMEFCKAFNAQTQNLEKGMPIPVVITVYSDRSFTFIMKTPPAAILLKKAAGIKSGSGRPNTEKVGTVTRAQLEEIAKTKQSDLTAADLDAAVRTIAGSARSMGLNVEGL